MGGQMRRCALVASVVVGLLLTGVLVVPVGSDHELNADGSAFVTVYNSLAGADITPVAVVLGIVVGLAAGVFTYAAVLDGLRHKRASGARDRDTRSS